MKSVSLLPLSVPVTSDNDDDALKGPARPQSISVTATAILNSKLTAHTLTGRAMNSEAYHIQAVA